MGTSWRNRPLHAGWQWGWFYGDTLVGDRVEQGDNMWGGYQIGWDFDHYWGTEARFCVSHPDVWSLREPSDGGYGQAQYFDVHLLYYPWGDARWRPFVSIGVGWGNFRFDGDAQQRMDDTLYAFPLGAGVKYLLSPWMALRLTASDNLALGAYHLSTMHNVSLSGGVEVHFGGARTLYYP
jgi:opacity protein-like surface antigen